MSEITICDLCHKQIPAHASKYWLSIGLISQDELLHNSDLCRDCKDATIKQLKDTSHKSKKKQVSK